jgi:hypothetical protein
VSVPNSEIVVGGACKRAILTLPGEVGADLADALARLDAGLTAMDVASDPQ